MLLKLVQALDLEYTSYECVQDVLRARAESVSAGHVLFYPLGSTASSTPRQVSYSALFAEAQYNSRKLSALTGFVRGKPVLLHLVDHWDAILWFWSVLLAHGLPVMSSPLSNVEEHRAKHLEGLSKLLESPICITREDSMHLFQGSGHTLQLYTVESLDSADVTKTALAPKQEDSSGADHLCGGGVDTTCDTVSHQTAALMLTSGSTGNAKAVRLRHGQMLASVAGKMAIRQTPVYGAFLNWIGMDHVAALVETHLAALWLGVDQVHVHPADIVASPQLFLDLLSRHRVTRTFAPNFFLAKLVSTDPKPTTTPWDLSYLTALVSGGEANDIKTCTAAASLFCRYGAPANVIQPGFGMTETCAGCIYNVDCPAEDLKQNRSVASLGRCIPGVEMRVVGASGPGDPGDLEVRGAAVFDGYYQNPAATAEAFASGGGWFRTGDKAAIDKDGNLCLIGRSKDVININGVKIVTADVQAALEAALRGTSVSRVVCFPSRASGAATEQITVACVPRTCPLSDEDAADVDGRVVEACAMVTTAGRPAVFVTSNSSLPLLPLSALGKISGAKMRTLFEAGAFDDDVSHHRRAVGTFRRRTEESSPTGKRATEDQEKLKMDFALIKGLKTDEIGLDTPLFELGFTSMDFIKLKAQITSRLGRAIETMLLFKNSTVRLLAAALSVHLRAPANGSQTEHFKGGTGDDAYEPVVVLRSAGTKAPLWLVHAAVGEVLAFVDLARHMAEDDRPVYALRARGLEPSESTFARLSNAMDAYLAGIRRQQPHGPYVIAGYSYGGMLAFEIAKALESAGEVVGFLGSFDHTPHLAHAPHRSNWNVCLLKVANFLELVDEATMDEMVNGTATYREAPRAEALRLVLARANPRRLRELQFDEATLLRWADVAFDLLAIAVGYEPMGSVGVIDVFHAEPLRSLAPSREDWVRRQGLWKDFCRTEPRLHCADGGHYTLLGPEHVAGFAVKLRAAMEARGV